MIPAFDGSTGYLPPGLHEATWPEVVDRYGYTPQRRAILDRMRLTLQLLALAGGQRVFLGGSFVTAKPDPPDFDGCFDDSQTNTYMLEEFLAVYGDLEAGGHLYPLSHAFEPDATPCLTNYTRDSRKGEKEGARGVVVLDITTVPALEIQAGSDAWYVIEKWHDDETETDEFGVPVREA